MSSDLIRCCICFSDYDLEEHIPVMLSQCGHNTCEPCANSIIKSAHPECPVCRKMFSKDPTATRYVPNRQIKEQLEKEGQYQSCKVHEGRLLEFYCKTDKCKVCVDCCFSKGEQSHKGHEIERIADLKEKIDNKRKVFEEHLESCRMTHEEVKTLVSKRKQELIEKNKEIERVAKLIALEASLRARGVFDEEEEKMDKICGKDSDITKKIQDKVSEYKNIKTADLTLLLEENPEEFTKKLDNSKVQEYLQSLNNQIELPGTPIIVEDSNKITIDTPTRLARLKVNSYLAFELNENELSITSSTVLNKNVNLDLVKFDKEVKRVKVIFDKFDLHHDDMQVITYLWTRLQPQINSIDIIYQHIQISADNDSPFQEHLITFPRMIFSNPKTLKSIGLNFFYSIGSERYVNLLREKILPQCPNLTSLSLAFTDTDFSSQTLHQFINYLNSRPQGITHFSLTLNQKYNGFIPLKLANLKSFKFATDQTKFAKSIEKGFLYDTLIAMKSLEECDIELPNNSSHHLVALFSLFHSFSQLKTLRVNMRNIRMLKSELDNLTTQLRSHLKGLQNITVKISETELPSQVWTSGIFSHGLQNAFVQQSSTASFGGLFGSQPRSTAPSSVFGQQQSSLSGFFYSNNQAPQQSSVLANIPQQSRNLFDNTNNRHPPAGRGLNFAQAVGTSGRIVPPQSRGSLFG